MHCFNSNCKRENFFHYAVLFYSISLVFTAFEMSCYRSETDASYLSCKAKCKDKSTSGSDYRNVIKINENEFSTLVKIMSGDAF